MSLNDWLKSGLLTKHKSSSREISELFRIIERDLAASLTKGLVSDWRFNIAYNAALQLAKVALAASGYDATRLGHHYRIIQSLRFTVGADADLVDEFNRARKKRNIADYERAGTISELEAEEMIQFAQKLKKDVEIWLCKVHPTLSGIGKA